MALDLRTKTRPQLATKMLSFTTRPHPSGAGVGLACRTQQYTIAFKGVNLPIFSSQPSSIRGIPMPYSTRFVSHSLTPSPLFTRSPEVSLSLSLPLFPPLHPSPSLSAVRYFFSHIPLSPVLFGARNTSCCTQNDIFPISPSSQWSHCSRNEWSFCFHVQPLVNLLQSDARGGATVGRNT